MKHKTSQPQRIVVGLSGGVDSALTAWLPKRQGHEVVGIFMKIWVDEDDSARVLSTRGFIAQLGRGGALVCVVAQDGQKTQAARFVLRIGAQSAVLLQRQTPGTAIRPCIIVSHGWCEAFNPLYRQQLWRQFSPTRFILRGRRSWFVSASQRAR